MLLAALEQQQGEGSLRGSMIQIHAHSPKYQPRAFSSGLYLKAFFHSKDKFSRIQNHLSSSWIPGSGG